MTVEIELDNMYATVRNMRQEDENELWRKLAFKEEVFGVPEPRWRHLYNRRTKKTYAGLLDELVEFCEEQGIAYAVTDTRERVPANANFALVKQIDTHNGPVDLEMRPYQRAIIEAARARDVIQAATGAGKTFIMAALMAKFNVKPVMVFADKITLCEQLRSEFEKFLGVKVGMVGGDGANTVEDITVCSLQSATAELVQDASLIMFDECLAGETMVTMADGSEQRIDALVNGNAVGQQVLSVNEAHEVQAKTITAVQKIPVQLKPGTRMYKVRVRHFFGKVRDFICTDDHKVYTSKGYIEASKLIPGESELVEMVNGAVRKAELMYIDELTTKPEFVYDITVDDNHNFFANGTLVSNCHHIPADTCMNVCAMAKHAFYRIGVSATPWRDAGDDMLIDAALAHRRPELAITASRLIDEGYLVPPSIYFVPVKQQFTGRNYQKVYAAAVVENEERNLMVRKIAKQMFIRDKHILILVQQVKHGEILKKMITEALGGEQTSSVQVTKRNGQKVLVRVPMVEFMNGSDDATRRAAVLQAVREEKCRVLIATVIADEGLDLPILDTLVLAGGGKSSTRAFQRVGRVLRPYGDKTKAIVFDFEDFTPMLRRHARVRRKLYKTEPAWEIGKFVVSPYDNPPQE